MNKQLIVGLLVVAACGKKGGSADSVTKADADAVNALIPAEMKGKLEFEAATIEDGMGRHPTKYSVVAPKGWKKGFMPGSLEPADSDNFGSQTMGKTSFKVGSNCDGSCEKKDWAAVVEKVYYNQFTSGQVTGKVIKDDKRPTGRTLVFQMEPKTEQQGAGVTMTSGEKKIQIITTWWTDGATKHYVCQAELGEPAFGLAAAFEKACSKVAVDD
ncbi:MAG: hypothetical protein JWO36_2178 [Myxococcales bacterium]|nr:hypothetical protein [Myxococcales bacterium]